MYFSQELHSLHGHIQGLVATGNAQSSCDCSLMEWERLQGAVAVVCDKAMQCLVIGALQLCYKGTENACLLAVSAVNFCYQGAGSTCLVLSAVQLCRQGMHHICIETFVLICESVFV